MRFLPLLAVLVAAPAAAQVPGSLVSDPLAAQRADMERGWANTQANAAAAAAFQSQADLASLQLQSAARNDVAAGAREREDALLRLQAAQREEALRRERDARRRELDQRLLEADHRR